MGVRGDNARVRRLLAAGLVAAVGSAVFAALSRSAFARTYTITDGERVVTYTTFATSPAEVLGEVGVMLSDWDSFTAGGSDIRVNRVQRMRVILHGKSMTVTTAGETVEQLLQRLDIGLSGEDVLSHKPEDFTFDGMELRIDRHVTQLESYTVAIPRQVRYCQDPTLPEGVQQVLSEGADGTLACTARVSYINSQETERVVLSQRMTAAAAERVVAVGTGQQLYRAQTGLTIGDGFIRLPTGEVLRYYDTAQVRATAYTHTDEGCDFITYTGTRVRIGTVAVDPRYIPYGTRMFIVSNDGCYTYGISVAEDCGGAIKGDRIDLYFPTYDECIQFGRRDCTIYFLG